LPKWRCAQRNDHGRLNFIRAYRMTINDAEVGGGTLVVFAAVIWFLNYRYKVMAAADNEDKLKATELQNKIDVDALSPSELDAELDKDGFGSNDPNKPTSH